MALIYLKYSNDSWSTESSQSFNSLITDIIPTKRIDKGENLDFSTYQHTLAVREKGTINLSIDADELYSTSKFNFLKQMFLAEEIRYSTDDVTYVDMIWDEEEFPEPDYLQGNRSFPSLSFSLKQKGVD